MSTFARQIESFALKVNTATEKVIRAVVIELFSSVIADTPVDTGRARGNWQTRVNTPATDEINRLDPSGFKSMAEARAANFKLGDVVYLTNNLPYINRLEFEGHSKQAPNGMVRKNVARIEGILRKAVSENKV